MKREIKFRFWDGDLNKMDYRHAREMDFLHPVIIPMQFIGIRDKTGCDIYEGDYLVDRWPVDEDKPELGENESLLPVVWDSEELQWCVDTSFAKDGSHLSGIIDYFGDCLEVKGNIYQNP